MNYSLSSANQLFADLTQDLPQEDLCKADLNNWITSHPVEFKKLTEIREEALIRAGYTTTGWHGTNSDFDEFKPDLWFAVSSELALVGGVKKPKTLMHVRLKINPKRLNEDEMEEFELATALSVKNPQKANKKGKQFLEDALDDGFDAVEFPGYGYLVNDPNSIKSTNPLILREGRVLLPSEWDIEPLSENKEPQNLDAEYLAAVGRGDVEEAERMVDEAMIASVRSMPSINFGDVVDGLKVRDSIPNQESIRASIENPEFLGLRAFPISWLSGKPGEETRLAEAINESGEINPLIIVVSGHEDGPAYVLEGAHRIDALFTLGKKEFPAQVIFDDSESMVARDNKGNVIPLSQRFAIENDKIHDAKYLKAVQKGDIDSAQKMLEKAARASGYSETVFHFTASKFTKFKNDRGIHFVTPHRAWAEKWGGEQEKGEILTLFADVSNIFDYENPKHVKALAIEASISPVGLTRIKKGDWTRIEDRSTLRAIKALGFDGVYASEDGVKNIGFFNPSKMKSASTVVYTDKGEIVPLSKRFNQTSSDIRGDVGEIMPAPVKNIQQAIRAPLRSLS